MERLPPGFAGSGWQLGDVGLLVIDLSRHAVDHAGSRHVLVQPSLLDRVVSTSLLSHRL